MHDLMVLLCDYNLFVFVESSTHLLGFTSDGCAQILHGDAGASMLFMHSCYLRLNPFGCLAQVFFKFSFPGFLYKTAQVFKDDSAAQVFSDCHIVPVVLVSAELVLGGIAV